MTRISKARDSAATGRCLNWMMVLLALAGLALDLWLAFQHLTGSHLAGCGAGGPCDEVLGSRWSEVFGIPVAILGVLAHGILLFALAMGNRRLVTLCLGAILGAALWFVFVQIFLLGKFCPWCMAGHTVAFVMVGIGFRRECVCGDGMMEVVVAGVCAAFTVVGISMMQVLGPQPASHRIDDAGNGPAPALAGIHARGNGRKAVFDDGRRIYDVDALPHLGPSGARHVMVEYFDYQCSSCRTMRGFLESLMRKHPADICVILLPVPLDHGCNPALPAVDPGHPGSCDLTRIALAAWRVDATVFPTLHQMFLADPPPESSKAMKLAGERLPAGRLETAMRDPWIDELVAANIADWVSFSGKSAHLPKLLISGKRILHGLPSGEADFIRVMEQELGLPASVAAPSR